MDLLYHKIESNVGRWQYTWTLNGSPLKTVKSNQQNLMDHNRQTNKMNAELFIIKSTLQTKIFNKKIKACRLHLENGNI